MKGQVVWSYFIMVSLVFFANVGPVFAWEMPIYEDTFEGIVNWSAENGVWEIGTPTSGPGAAHSGMQCAGTILDGQYPIGTDSRLIGPYTSPWEQGIDLPPLTGNEELHLQFWHWFSYSWGDYAQVQISVYDNTSGWSAWENISNSIGTFASQVWSLKSIDISQYAGQKVRFAFLHMADSDGNRSAGWYIDDVSIVKKVPKFSGDFELGWNGWHADNGIWEIGTPAYGPDTPVEGTRCAGTILNDRYPYYTDSRLVSPAVFLDDIVGDEELHLQFWHWFSYSWGDYAQVQISVYDNTSGWSAWENISNSIGTFASQVWSLKSIDISQYAGQKVRFAFLHMADSDGNRSAGWYIDDVSIVKKVPKFSGDFELGWNGWHADNGIWEIGTPAYGPGSPVEGSLCAGTVLNSEYPYYTDSRLINSPIKLTDCTYTIIYLKFQEWFSYSDDHGEVQISVKDPDTDEWSTWVTLSQSSGSSPAWTTKYVDLSSYAGTIFRIGFLHITNQANQGSGWYIDNIELVGPEQIMPKIDNIIFAAYIPDQCDTSLIDVFASEPCDGDLTYIWQLSDGGTLQGEGASVEFVPSETRIEPYHVRVAAVSQDTFLSSHTRTLKIFTQVLYDANDDGDITEETISRFAEEFGLIACDR